MRLIPLLRRLRVQLGLVRRRRMEVTRHNFDSLLPEVLEDIDKAVFVAIDGEFTGLVHDKSKANSHFDTPADRYEKIREICQRFLLVQFGLCAFHYDPETKRFSNRAYNFYIWPRSHTRNSPDNCFMVQPSSIDFLCQQSFDFNKLFNDGISYLRPHEEARMRQELEEERLRHQRNTDTVDMPVPEEQKAFLDNIVARVQNMIESGAENGSKEDGDKKEEKKEEKKTLELGTMNAFQRRLVYQTLGKTFGSRLTAETCEDRRSMRVTLNGDGTEDCKEQREQQRHETNLANLDRAIGFGKVIRRISAKRKLVVGHNMLLDVGHTLNQFVTPLPSEYEEFKELSRGTFGNLIDTKLMASSFPFKEDMLVGTSLNELYNRLTEQPFEMPEMHKSAYFEGDKERYHEAGYDAYVTGMCFIAMCQRLNAIASKGKSGKDDDKAVNMRLLAPFLNKLFLMRIADIPYMNLDGADLSPSRSHVFHVSFPSSWRTNDIVILFAPLGQIFISWINDTSAFVSLATKDNAAHINKIVVPAAVVIIPYEQFRELSKQPSVPTGITPSLEKSSLSFGLEMKKKRVADDKEVKGSKQAAREIKRTKSMIEEDNGAKGDDDKSLKKGAVHFMESDKWE